MTGKEISDLILEYRRAREKDKNTQHLSCSNCRTPVDPAYQNVFAEDKNKYQILCFSCIDANRLGQCSCQTWFNSRDNDRCPDCMDAESQKCRSCGCAFAEDRLFFHVCISCVIRSRNSSHSFFHGLYRTIGVNDPQNTYKTIKHKRNFGVELESSTMTEILFKDTVFSAEKDGSISGQEFVSPILSGDMGARAIEDLCKRKPPSNHTCGFHVHLDASDLKWWDLISIGRGYTILQPIIFHMFGKERRGSKFCKPITTPYFTMPRKGHMIRLIYGDRAKVDRKKKYITKRYEFLNVHSYFYHKTLEIRIHEGTFDYEKIINWINFNQYLFDYFTKNIVEPNANPFAILKAALPPDLLIYVESRLIEHSSAGCPDCKFLKDPGLYKPEEVAPSVPRVIDFAKKKMAFFREAQKPLSHEENLKQWSNIPAPRQGLEQIRQSLRATSLVGYPDYAIQNIAQLTDQANRVMVDPGISEQESQMANINQQISRYHRMTERG